MGNFSAVYFCLEQILVHGIIGQLGLEGVLGGLPPPDQVGSAARLLRDFTSQVLETSPV